MNSHQVTPLELNKKQPEDILLYVSLLDITDLQFVISISFVTNVSLVSIAVLTSDYATCLTCLMKFPPVGDVHYFIQKALYLREPNVSTL